MRIKLFALLIFAAICIGDAFTEAQAEIAINEYVRLKDEQRWDEALKVIRKEIGKPMINDTDYLANLRILGMSALAHYAEMQGYNLTLDAEAKRYYQEGLAYGNGDMNTEAGMHASYALYFSLTNRNGYAIPYFDLQLQIWEDLGDVYQIIKTNDAKASAYNDMGELALRDFYRQKTMKIGADYFQFGVRPDDPYEWLQYSRMIKRHAGNIAGSGKGQELKSILDLHFRIADKYLAFLNQTYKQHAELYAIDGQFELAEENFRLAEERLASDKKRLRKKYDKDFWSKMDLDMTCTHANILYRAESFSEAAEYSAECTKGWRDTGELGGPTLGLMGIIHESAGKDAQALRLYSEAINLVEDTRSSYDVAQRTSFFRQNVSRRPYWGLIRLLGKRAANTGEADDFFAFLQASERIRARQFGELVSAESGGAGSIELLKSYVDSLDTDTAVVTYILTDSAFVIGAFTRDEHLVKVEPYDRRAFRSRIRNIVALLADPASPMPDLQQILLEAGGLVMDPIRELIGDKKKLLVITDGELNMVPFDLWSANRDSYEPLMQSKTVRSAPALRLLASASDNSTGSLGLFALGDPIYPDPTRVIAGIQSSEIEQATRSIKFRSYFAPLPETRTEVESIAQLFGDQQTAVLLGEKALESEVKNTALDEYRYLHFATHGILGGEVPGVGEPALVLGREDSEDGFLKASEAERLSLNAELTVLSACNTGSGEYVNGEGVMGISRSFLIAGSKSVLVSLWPVASKATEDLMVLFYGYIQDDVPADTALRAAKQDIMDTRPHPFFWAPFILVSQQ